MWELEIQGNKYNSTNRNPNFVIFDTGKAILKLLIESNGTCLDSIEKEFNFNRLKPDFPVGVFQSVLVNQPELLEIRTIDLPIPGHPENG